MKSVLENKNRLWLAFLLLAITLPSRLINIDRAINIDEPWWVISGANFYYAVTHRNFADTYFEYHPGVTNTWIIAASLHFYFPEYRGFGQGYFDQRKPFFEEFMRDHGKKTIVLVRNARYIQAGVLAIAAVIAFFLLSLLVGENISFLSIALASIAPFFLGHSRLLNMESMASLFTLASFLGIYVYLKQDRKIIYLLFSGAAFGLAQLTKSTSIALAGVVGLILFVNLFQRNGKALGAKVWDAFKTFIVWFATAALVYFILWPGMWVAPEKMLSEVYGNAFSYAFQGARLDVTEELEPAKFSVVTRFDAVLQYLRWWASSTTFITWLGLIFTGFIFIPQKKDLTFSWIRPLLIYLTVLGVSFILMFGIAQGRNDARYIMTSYVCFDVMAGIGWGYIWRLVQNRWAGLNHVWLTMVVFVVLILGQIGFGLPYAPYYFTYKNPFAKQAATLGYGEGMDQAADYLAQKPNAKNIRAYVYNGMGTFSYFFPGETLVFKRVYLVEKDYAQVVNDMRNSDYLVLYPIVREKQPETEVMYEVLEGIQPEKVILINGLPYIRIYDISKIPQGVFDLLLQK